MKSVIRGVAGVFGRVISHFGCRDRIMQYLSTELLTFCVEDFGLARSTRYYRFQDKSYDLTHVCIYVYVTDCVC